MPGVNGGFDLVDHLVERDEIALWRTEVGIEARVLDQDGGDAGAFAELDAAVDVHRASLAVLEVEQHGDLDTAGDRGGHGEEIGERHQPHVRDAEGAGRGLAGNADEGEAFLHGQAGREEVLDHRGVEGLAPEELAERRGAGPGLDRGNVMTGSDGGGGGDGARSERGGGLEELPAVRADRHVVFQGRVPRSVGPGSGANKAGGAPDPPIEAVGDQFRLLILRPPGRV